MDKRLRLIAEFDKIRDFLLDFLQEDKAYRHLAPQTLNDKDGYVGYNTTNIDVDNICIVPNGIQFSVDYEDGKEVSLLTVTRSTDDIAEFIMTLDNAVEHTTVGKINIRTMSFSRSKCKKNELSYGQSCFINELESKLAETRRSMGGHSGIITNATFDTEYLCVGSLVKVHMLTDNYRANIDEESRYCEYREYGWSSGKTYNAIVRTWTVDMKALYLYAVTYEYENSFVREIVIYADDVADGIVKIEKVG
jgi:hypothetical protein